MKNQKVIIIIPYLSSGGAERTAINLAENIKNDYDISFVLFDAEKNTYEFDKNIDVIDLKIKSSNNIFGKIKNTINKYLKIKSIKRKLKVDISISFLREPNFINVLTKRKGEKTIISIRNTMSELDNSKIKRMMTHYGGKKADIIVTLSKMVKKDQIEKYGIEPSKIKVIYNACDMDRLKKLSKEKIEDTNLVHLLENNSGNVVINIGRLTYQKGQKHLIKAFKEVVRELPDAKLFILGKGELENDLNNLINKLDLKNNVFLLGFFNNPYKFLIKANVFAFSSMFEGLGNIILEAMACGLPIISTDCKYGPREIIAPNSNLEKTSTDIEYEEYGVLVPKFEGDDNSTKQEKQMANAIISMLKDDKIRRNYTKKSLERIMFFSMERNKNEWENLLK